MIIFHIEYYTRRDERLSIIFDDGAEYGLRCESDGQWSAEVTRCEGCAAAYRYLLRATDGSLRREEWGKGHRLDAGSAERVEVFDHWHERPAAAPFYSSFFTRGVFRRTNPREAASAIEGRILLRVEAPTVASDEAVAVVGEHAAAGCWQVERAVAMADGTASVWSVSLPASVAGSEFKFIVTDAATGRFKRYEGGDNRRFPAVAADAAIVVDGLRMRDENPLWRGAGVAVPLFSLRSGHGWGCGEFRDLKLLADWASATGLSVIQLLPVNDTSATGTWRDSYPYNTLSCFALHPMYASAEAVTERCSDCVRYAELAASFGEFAAAGARLDGLSAVDYEAVIKLKTDFLRRAYDLCGREIMSSDEYKAFERKNAEWLFPYAVFSALRDESGTTDHTQWGEMKRYDAARAERYARENAHAVGFRKFVQYLLDEELREAGDYARSRGVLLKGDIPIGVSPSSVEVWRSPELFNLTMSAGAPPDDFAVEGQNWGFPTYDWRRMAEDGYAWWRSRLCKMAEYFDAYRIDHILGFFRIWEVPREAVGALTGHFNPSLPYSAEEIAGFGFPFDASVHVARDLKSSDVLFLEDPYAPKRYFPRIEGCGTAAFAALDNDAQRAYSRLYEDFYYRRHNDFWRDCALRRLPKLISATGMLACGEDLGMIPACVPDVMRSEQILSLEIERMPKRFGTEFGDPMQYPYLSVASPSTHDMSTVRGWWRENPEATCRYWRDIAGHEGEPPAECSGAAARDIAERHMRSRSMLAILPLQDWLAVDEDLRADDPDAERINVPADPDHYWRYRMHIRIEELLAADRFNDTVRALTALRRGK